MLLSIVSFVFKKAQPTFHYFLWCIVLVRLIVPINIPIPFGLTHPLRAVSETKISEITKKTNFNATNFIFKTLDDRLLLSSDKEIKHSELNLQLVVSILWFSIVILLVSGTLLWNLHAGRIIKKFNPIERRDIIDFVENKCRELKLKNKIEILCMKENMPMGPTVAGLINPKILLPYKIIEEWPIENIEPLILHELVHIKHRDLYINWIQIIIQILYFFDPFIWFANWKIRDIREQVCDDIAINYIGNKRKRYSMSILNVIEIIPSEHIWGYAYIGFSERKSSLAKRMIRISSGSYFFHKPLNFISNIFLCFTTVALLALACDYAPEKIIGNVETTNNKILITEEQDIKERIKVFINENGEYKIEGVIIDYKNIENALTELIRKTNKNKLLIITDKNTRIKDISYLTEISLRIGIKKIARAKTTITTESELK